MAILRAFNEVEGWDDFTGLYEALTTSPIVDSDIHRSCLSLNSGARALMRFAGMSSGWIRFRASSEANNHGGGWNSRFLFSLFDTQHGAPSTKILFGSPTSSGTSRVARSFWEPDDYSNTLFSGYNGAFDIDLHWILDDQDGIVQVFVDEVLKYEYVGDTTNGGLFTEIDQLAVYGSSYYNYGNHFNNVILSDKPTFGGRVYTLPIENSGTLPGWVGDVDNIKGTAVSQLGGMQANLNNQTHTFALAAMPALPEGVVANAMIISANARHADDADVQYASLVSIQDGTTYESDKVKAPYPASGPLQLIMEANPVGGMWTSEAINGAEFGIRAKT